MSYGIVIYSKYFLAGFLLLFLACGLYALRYPDVRSQRRMAGVQTVLLFLTQLCAYLTIVIRTQRSRYLLLYAFLLLLTFAVFFLCLFLYPGANRILLNHMGMLFTAGMIVLTRIEFDKAVRQLVIAAFAFLIGLSVPWLVTRLRILRRLGWLFALAGIFALALVLVLGQFTYGSKLSWTVAGLTFQPSEFVKILYVLFLASVLGKNPGFFKVVLAGAGAAAHVLILVLSKDLGSALIFFVVYVLVITVASHHLAYAAAGAVFAVCASAAAYRLFSHVQVRVQAWRDPWSVIDGQGYQVTQSLFAMSRGGAFGLGIGKGTPSDIPFVETDFIFPALVEEMGLVFGIGIVMTGLVIFLLLMRLAGGLKDGFYKNLAVGYGVMFAFQIFLTIGGGTKFIPLTGVTLPLVSYGGSSVTATVLTLFLAQGIWQMRYDEELKLEKQRKKRAKESRQEQTEGDTQGQ